MGCSCARCRPVARVPQQGLGCLPTLWLLGCGAVLVGIVATTLVPAANAKTPKAKKAKPAAASALPSASARYLLTSSRVQLTARARHDLETPGRLNGCLIRVLTGLAKRHTIGISVLRTGHSTYVKGSRRVSNHTVGRGADIWMVDGGLVRGGHRPSRAAVDWLGSITGACRPSEIGSPFWVLNPQPRFFTDSGHLDHLHIGIGRN